MTPPFILYNTYSICQKPILSTLLYNVHVYCIMYTEYKIPFSFIFKMVFSIFNNLTRFYFASAKLCQRDPANPARVSVPTNHQSKYSSSGFDHIPVPPSGQQHCTYLGTNKPSKYIVLTLAAFRLWAAHR